MLPSDPRLLPQVLYIEDNADERSLVRRLLSGRYIVLEADDPLDGLQLAEETQPDIVLIDYNLPRLSGSEAATRLRHLLPNAPLVITTADSNPGLKERALAAGASGFINKPINVDTFVDEVDAFLHGRQEKLDDAEHHLRVYQQELVERLEGNIRQLSQALDRNQFLLSQNNSMIQMLERRQKLLEAAARVSHEITSILDLDELLRSTVDIICNEFSLYYSGVFLTTDDNQWAVLHAGSGDAGTQMLNDNFKLPIDQNSMVGLAILEKRAHIILDTEADKARFQNPYLPETRSELVLPLIIKGRVLGALTVQSDQMHGFAEEDITAVQGMADQVAIAINNAQLVQKLDAATSELVRTKTFEAIATATGEAIHWVGNKAAPIPGSTRRLREDLEYLLALLAILLKTDHPAQASMQEIANGVLEEAVEMGINVEELVEKIASYPPRRLLALLSVDSMLEDFRIIEHSAKVILSIKEDLIGPARQRHPQVFSLIEMLKTYSVVMGLPKGVLQTDLPADLPESVGDVRQLEQVFNNLIKNSWEALRDANVPNPKIWINAHKDEDPAFILVTVRDNGPGIPLEIQEKIWVSFFTTKGGKGGTGLGLSACMQIVNQNNGKIWLHSIPGKGATFYVRLPAAKDNPET
jgi:signal transduction histidine kinase/DNA-binding NarL/FixJ family response regulator